MNWTHERAVKLPSSPSACARPAKTGQQRTFDCCPHSTPDVVTLINPKDCYWMKTLQCTLAFFIALLLSPCPSQAQIFANGGEILADIILELEDLKAQCLGTEERAVFEYAQSLKRLEWYRSEYYSPVDEEKMWMLALGIVQQDTGRPVLPGYRDIRDTTRASDTAEDPYALARSNYSDFYWHSKPKPKYALQACKSAAQKWLRAATDLEPKLPPPFPEVRKYLDLADPSELLAIAKRLHVCGINQNFGSPTRFNAWISNNFSYSYGRREKVSPLILGQLKRELGAFGAAARAAEKITFGSAADASCPTLISAINTYNSRVGAL